MLLGGGGRYVARAAGLWGNAGAVGSLESGLGASLGALVLEAVARSEPGELGGRLLGPLAEGIQVIA